MPLPHLVERRARSLVWATATMDRDGRLSDAFLFGALGWTPATCLDIRVDRGLILVGGSDRRAPSPRMVTGFHAAVLGG